jgi:WD40 repeat protein
MAFSPDGKRLLTGCSDGDVFLRDVDARTVLGNFTLRKKTDNGKGAQPRYEFEDDSVESVAFSRDGNLFAVGTEGGRLVVRKIVALPATAEGPRIVLTDECFIPFVYTSSDGKEIGDGVAALAFMPDNMHIIVGTTEGHICDTDLRTKRSRELAYVNGRETKSVAVSADGRLVAWTFDDEEVWVRDSTRASDEVFRLPELEGQYVAFASAQNHLVVSDGRRLIGVDLATGAEDPNYGWDETSAWTAKWFAASADGRVIVVSDYNGNLHLVHGDTGKLMLAPPARRPQ